MPDSLKGFEAEPPRDLATTLRVMESRIDGLVDDSMLVRWDLPRDTNLVQASRHLTYPDLTGREELVVARALGPDLESQREIQYAIRNRHEVLQWPGGIEITADDVLHSVFGNIRKRSLDEVADRFLARLNSARPFNHNTHEVRVSCENMYGLSVVEHSRLVRKPRERGLVRGWLRKLRD